MEILSNEQTGSNLIPPRKTSMMELLLKIKPDHQMAQEFLERQKTYNENFQKHLDRIPKAEQKPLPELKPIDVENFCEITFKSAFSFFRSKDFDENANNAEARKFARTLCAYFIGKKAFTQSPLLWRKIEPNTKKGLMVIGNYGTGKTSVLQTFHEMFKYSFSHPITVKDIEGTNQFLGRYKLGFGYYTANEVVKAYESASSPEEKDIFWKKKTHGMIYFDDVMTENQASNYGKIELFKNIFEERYENEAKTIISLNYVGDSVDSTLNAFGDRYGERVYDRIKEMFNIVELKGKSLRR